MLYPREVNDTALASIPHLLEPLKDLLDQQELQELGQYFIEVQVATLQAYQREIDARRRRLFPLSEN